MLSKEVAFEKRNTQAYNKLWPHIANMTLRVHKQKPAHLLKKLKTRILLKKGKVIDLKSLLQAVRDAETEQETLAKQLVHDLLDDPFNSVHDNSLENLDVIFLENDQFLGQVVREGHAIPYFSLITKESWLRSGEWQAAKQFAV